MKLKYLLEGITDTVFHSTSFTGAIKILKTDQFLLSDSEASELKNPPVDIYKYPHFLSLSRTKNNSYAIASVSAGGVILELDGRKLSNLYKGVPVDWYKDVPFEERRNREVVLKNGAMGEKGFLGFYEAEDRLYSKDGVIRDAKKYIKAIHTPYRDLAEKRGYYDDLYKEGLGIPIYVYPSEKNLITGNKKGMYRYKPKGEKHDV